MSNRRERNAYGVFIDGLNIKLAHVVASGDEFRIEQLEEKELSFPLFLQDNEGQKTRKEPGTEDVNLESQLENMSNIDTDKMMDDINSEAKLSGKVELRNLLYEYDLSNGRIAMNSIDERITYQNIGVLDSKKKTTNKKLRKILLKKHEIQNANVTLDHFMGVDDEVIVFTHRGRLELLDAIKDINYSLTKKKFFYNHIDTNEVSLINLFNVTHPSIEGKYSLLLYVGFEYKVGIVLKGGRFVKKFPIIITGTSHENRRRAIFSKVMLEQDATEYDIIEDVYFCGDFADDEDIEFFRKMFPETSNITRFDATEIDGFYNGENLFSADQMASYAIPISMAFKALYPKRVEIASTNLIPSAIVEGQKPFKLSWHGLVMLVGIFAISLYGTYVYGNTKSSILRVKNENRQIEETLKQSESMMFKIEDIRKELLQIEENISRVSDLVQNKNQWHYIVHKINESFSEKTLSWLTQIESNENGFTINGFTTERENIVEFAKLFPAGMVTSVSEIDIENVQVWSFKIQYNFLYPETLPKIYSISSPDEKDSNTKTSYALNKPLKSKVEKKEEVKTNFDLNKIDVKQDSVIIKAYNNAVATYFDGKVIEALPLFKEFREKYPEHPLAYNAKYFTGECFYNIGEYESAENIFNDILKINGNKYGDALIMLGNTYRKRKDFARAKDYYYRIVNENLEKNVVKIAKRKLYEIGY